MYGMTCGSPTAGTGDDGRPLELVTSGSEKQDIIANTAMLTRLIVATILRNPEQWSGCTAAGDGVHEHTQYPLDQPDPCRSVFIVLMFEPRPCGRSGRHRLRPASITDWLDGYLQGNGTVTRIGKLLDPVADKILMHRR